MLPGSFQGMEWVIILLIVLLIFGPTKLPQLARGLGQALYEFRRASQGVVEDLERSQSEAKKSLQGIDDETLRKLAEKLGVKDAEKKKRDDLIVEIINEAKKKGLLDEIKVEAEQSTKSTNTET
ncbi:Sec-independent secretion pathway protein [Pyrodictium delaneyi]|uniref:Sec-independent protein translocase protein TatA n=1 Tax=Pyrodictium delaneyi TaxID=1273541 RepID=A0A0P0N3Z8_9CREN|nr:twin-arginine translocase TatA/TatE family subunit [Pyrodictium delaneyi]ALL01342.1 Sec-independent secretion pathway protein [Pyrodictium delaneyi]OWJ53828.1 twin-arginine translocase TatA/TatE family subunit [Pyrodictium delaneyi]